jgi:hypothetical protein
MRILFALALLVAAESIAMALPPNCPACRGDLTGDNVRTGLDIQAFSQCYLGGVVTTGVCLCADMDLNNSLDANDIGAFVNVLLIDEVCPPAMGACCRNSVCTDEPASQCIGTGGAYQGHGTDCQQLVCYPTGRCCDYSPVACFVETEVDCMARGGMWDGTVASCATPTTCPPSICSAFMGPNPPRRCWTPATTNASAVTSDLDDDFFSADDFSVTSSGTIGQLCWRGINLLNGTGPSCGEAATETFRVTYYFGDQFNVAPNTNQIVNTVLGQPAVFNVTPARLSAGFDTYRYEVFHTPVAVTVGTCYWIEIINTTPAPDCMWFWLTSNQGNDRHAKRSVDSDPNAPFLYAPSSLTMCMGPATLNYAPTACPITAPVPANDTCAQGQAASFALVNDVPTAGATIAANNDAPAVTCGEDATGPDVYYNYTAVLNGQTTFKLCPTAPNPPGASYYDAIISVHTDCPATEANKLGCDDDSCGNPGGPSLLILPNLAATTNYVVRIDGWGGAIGSFSVVVTQP